MIAAIGGICVLVCILVPVIDHIVGRKNNDKH